MIGSGLVCLAQTAWSSVAQASAWLWAGVLGQSGGADLLDGLLRLAGDPLGGPVDRWRHPWLGLLALLAPLAWLLARGPSGLMLHSGAGEAIGVRPTIRQRTSWLPGLLRGLAIVLLAMAAARPQRALDQSESITEALAIQLVIDRSSSMAESMRDVSGQVASRLDVVKSVVDRFLAGTLDRPPAEGADEPSDRRDLVGMVAFARYADTICPPVQDHETAREMLRNVRLVSPRSSEDGTAIGRALILANARLSELMRELDEGEGGRRAEPRAGPTRGDRLEITSRVIVLLTDGDNNVDPHPLSMIEDVEQWGVRIYTIGIVGGGIFGRAGVDVGTLRELASRTGGRFYEATDAAALAGIYAEIDRLEKTQVRVDEFTSFEELFLPLALGAFALLLVEAVARSTVYRRVP